MDIRSKSAESKSNGGTVDLRLRVKAGPQETKNLAPDHNPKGRPKREQSSPTLPLTTQHATQPATVDLTGPAEEIKTVPQVEIPLFIPPPNVPAFTEEMLVDEPNATATSIERTRQSNRKYQPTVEDELIESTPVPNKSLEQPRYFTRSDKRKRSASGAAKDERTAKIARAMIAELLDELDAVPGELKGPLESAFPTEATMIREQLGDEFFRVSILVRNFSGRPSSTVKEGDGDWGLG